MAVDLGPIIHGTDWKPSLLAGLQTHATEKLMETGRASWPDNPWTALNTTPAGYANTDADAAGDGQWRFKASTANITHMRGEGTIVHWDYRATISPGTNTGLNSDAIGDLSDRGVGADGNAVGNDHVHN